MAQIALPALFNVAAGTFGGFVAAGIGLAVDSLIFSKILGGTTHISNPPLDNVGAVRGQDGLPIARVWGEAKVGGHVIWTQKGFTVVTDTQRKKVGKGQYQEIEDHTYYLTFAVAFCEGEVELVKLFFNDCPVDIQFTTQPQSGLHRGNLDDAIGTNPAIGDTNAFEFFEGTEDQFPSLIIEQTEQKQVDSNRTSEEDRLLVTAYRGISYIVFRQLELTKYFERMPRVSAIVRKKPRSANPYTGTYGSVPADSSTTEDPVGGGQT